jgi:AraC-like DNA-binding protein
MKLEQASPPPPLRDHVRCFQQRRAKIGDTPIVYPITARTDQFLEFYLQGRYVVRFGEAGRQELAPRAVVVGPSTRRLADLVLRAELDVFTVQCGPAGFYKLFGTPMNDFADQAYDAHSVIGPVLAELEQRLADASSFEERTCVAGDFLRQRLDEIGRPDGVSEFADRFLVGRGAISVGDAALKAGLSVRQFERRFCRQVGVAPKLYARIVRFNTALAAKASTTRRQWTDIAHAFGYYDQMHMIRDFEDFAGESPTAFMRRLSAMPEAWG